jgi:hypothetical protein
MPRTNLPYNAGNGNSQPRWQVQAVKAVHTQYEEARTRRCASCLWYSNAEPVPSTSSAQEYPEQRGTRRRACCRNSFKPVPALATRPHMVCADGGDEKATVTIWKRKKQHVQYIATRENANTAGDSGNS